MAIVQPKSSYYFRRSGLFFVDSSEKGQPRDFREAINVAINHFRAGFFWEQATPTSLEIEEDGDQPLQSWFLFFWEQAMPTSLEIEADCLRFLLRGNEGYLRPELIYKVINSCFRENLVQIYF